MLRAGVSVVVGRAILSHMAQVRLCVRVCVPRSFVVVVVGECA